MPGREGPCPELWKAAVVEDDALPHLQLGEHMTAGQVRHPELEQVFVQEFQKWFRKTKAGMTKGFKEQQEELARQLMDAARDRPGRSRGKAKTGKGKKQGRGRGRGRASANADGSQSLADYDDDELASPWLVVCECTADNEKISDEMRKEIETHVAEMLGWGNIKNRQLRELLEAYKTPDEALKLLLRGSNRMQREHQRQQERHQQQEHSKQQQGTSHISAESDEEDFVIVSRRTRVDSEEEAVKEEHAWFELKTDIPMNPAVRAGTVPETDERGPLRGQKGIWATGDVPAGSVLGPYRHYCLFASAYQKLLSSPPPAYEHRHKTWGLKLESYACNDDAGALVDPESGCYSFVYSGYGYGNHTGYANDPHADPVSNLFAPGKPDDYLGPLIKDEHGREVEGNCMCIVVRILDWPYLFMVTFRDVPKGGEFAYSYGHGYWSLISGAIHDAVREEELRLKLEKLERLQSQTQQTSGLTTTIQVPSGSLAVPTASESVAAARPEEVSSAKPKPPAAAAVSGLTSIGQGLQDMQLSSAMPPPAQQQPPEQGKGSLALQLPDQQHEPEGVGESPAGARRLAGAVSGATSLPQASTVAGSAAVELAAELSDLEDEASSGFPRDLMAYRRQPLLETEEQRQRLRAALDDRKKQQLNIKITDAKGEEQVVQRIDNPEIVKLIHRAEMRLSRELYRYQHGLRKSKLPRGWWDVRLANYERDEWEFIRRRDYYFTVGEYNSPNTIVRLTDEWREELEPIAKEHNWVAPTPRQDGVGVKRKHVTEVITRNDPAMVADLQQKRQKLAAAETDMEHLVGLLRDVHLFLQQGGIQLPANLQHQVNDVLQRHQQQPAAAARPAYVGAPIPGMGGTDSDSDSGDDSVSEEATEPDEPSDDAADSAGDAAGAVPAGRSAVPGTGSRGNGSQPPQQMPGHSSQDGRLGAPYNSREQGRQASESGSYRARSQEQQYDPGLRQQYSTGSYDRRPGSWSGQQRDSWQQPVSHGAVPERQQDWHTMPSRPGAAGHQQPTNQYSHGGQYNTSSRQQPRDSRQYQQNSGGGSRGPVQQQPQQQQWRSRPQDPRYADYYNRSWAQQR